MDVKKYVCDECGEAHWHKILPKDTSCELWGCKGNIMDPSQINKTMNKQTVVNTNESIVKEEEEEFDEYSIGGFGSYATYCCF